MSANTAIKSAEQRWGEQDQQAMLPRDLLHFMKEERDELYTVIARYEEQMLRMAQCAGEFAKGAATANSAALEAVQPEEIDDDVIS